MQNNRQSPRQFMDFIPNNRPKSQILAKKPVNLVDFSAKNTPNAPRKPILSHSVPSRLITKEERLALAKRQSEAMQRTSEAKYAKKMTLEREKARQIKAELAKKAAQEELRRQQIAKLRAKPHFINTKVQKRPLSSNSKGINTKPLSHSTLTPKTPKTPQKASKIPKSTSKNSPFQTIDQESLAPRTILVPTLSRKSINLPLVITATIVMGAIFGIIAYFALLAQ